MYFLLLVLAKEISNVNWMESYYKVAQTFLNDWVFFKQIG